MNARLILLGASALGLLGATAISLSVAKASQDGSLARAPARVNVPQGAFVMGANDGAKDEAPAHKVTVSAFAIDREEVTNARFQKCVAAGKCTAPKLASSQLRASYYGNSEYADFPVIFVSHEQASAFCGFEGGRLPTEAEWERAARGDDGRKYPWGNDDPSCTRANFGGAKAKNGCVGDTDRVGARPSGASPFGVLDMAGNVWEWTADAYDATYYERAPEADPKGPETGKLRVMRGGCWESGGSSLRATCRKAELPGTWAPNVGFRCAYPTSNATNATKGGK